MKCGERMAVARCSRSAFLPVVLLSLLCFARASAHHSHVNYEQGDTISVTGTVTEIQWINPHSWIFLNVVNDSGETEEWALEGGAPSQLLRRGWDQERLALGDTITALVRPLRSGSNGGLLGTIILSDGTAFCDPFDGAALDEVC
jgi:hypothetical protein